MGRVAPRMIPSIRLRRNYRDQWEIDQRRQQAIRLRLRRIRGRYGNLHNHWRTVRHPFPKRNHQDTNRVLQQVMLPQAIASFLACIFILQKNKILTQKLNLPIASKINLLMMIVIYIL